MDVVRLPKQHSKTLSSRTMSIGRRAVHSSTPSLHDRVDSDSNHIPTRTELEEEDSKTSGAAAAAPPPPSGYSGLPFSEYTPQHLAQFIGDSVRSEFAANGHCSELRDRVFGAEIDGAKLRSNLNGDFIKNRLQTLSSELLKSVKNEPLLFRINRRKGDHFI